MGHIAGEAIRLVGYLMGLRNSICGTVRTGCRWVLDATGVL